jgi:hypothetical protein
MRKHAIKLAATTALLLGLATHAYADVKLNDNITFSGYAAGAYMNYKPSPGKKVDGFFDASKPIPGGGDANDILARMTFNYKPFTLVLSGNYFPELPVNEFSLLDAYLTYDAGNGLTFTAGKFLSYLGYESFYPSLMDQISYANGDFLAPIAGYHSGGRIDFAAKTYSTGFALVDSVYSPNGGTRGDNEFSKNVGAEYFFSYTGITDLTLWAGLAYEAKGGYQTHEQFTMDYWAAYAVSKTTRVAAEFVYRNGGTGLKGYNWLLFVNQTFAEKFYATFRVSGEALIHGGPEFTKLTVGPGVNITPALTIRAEYSHYEYSNYTASSANFYGIQGVFKF